MLVQVLLQRNIRYIFAFEVVFGHDFVDGLHGIVAEVVVPHVQVNDVGVVDQAVLESCCVRVFNLVARDVELTDCFVLLEELSETFAEDLAERVT